jgi:hypothetical protein
VSRQKFHKGDLVRIAKDLGSCMSHFTADCDAIVLGSYRDQFGGSGNDTKSYSVFLKDEGECSWYEEWQLTLIQPARLDLLKEWETAMEKDREEKSEHEWIFEHGKEVLKEGYSASIETLAGDLGITNMWGSHGEGYVYMSNALAVMAHASRFLKKNDKKGWLKHAKKIREKIL